MRLQSDHTVCLFLLFNVVLELTRLSVACSRFEILLVAANDRL